MLWPVATARAASEASPPRRQLQPSLRPGTTPRLAARTGWRDQLQKITPRASLSDSATVPI